MYPPKPWLLPSYCCYTQIGWPSRRRVDFYPPNVHVRILIHHGRRLVHLPHAVALLVGTPIVVSGWEACRLPYHVYWCRLLLTLATGTPSALRRHYRLVDPFLRSAVVWSRHVEVVLWSRHLAHARVVIVFNVAPVCVAMFLVVIPAAGVGRRWVVTIVVVLSASTPSVVAKLFVVLEGIDRWA